MRAIRLPAIERSSVASLFIFLLSSSLTAHSRVHKDMSKSNMEDGVADAIAATGVICVVLATLMIWLSGLPS
jgi:hypothetical protein